MKNKAEAERDKTINVNDVELQVLEKDEEGEEVNTEKRQNRKNKYLSSNPEDNNRYSSPDEENRHLTERTEIKKDGEAQEEFETKEEKIKCKSEKQERRAHTGSAHNKVMLEGKDQEVIQIYNPVDSKANLVNDGDVRPPVEVTEKDLGPIILDLEEGFAVPEEEFDGFHNDKIDDELKVKLNEEVNKRNYPKQAKKDKEVVEGIHEIGYSVCYSDTGNICCGPKESNHELNKQLGKGVVFYFQIVKMFTILFFILVMINIPLIYYYTINYSESDSTSVLDFLFKTTIGNFGITEDYRCLEISLDDIINKEEIYLPLNCKPFAFDSYDIDFQQLEIYDQINSEMCQNNEHFFGYNYYSGNFSISDNNDCIKENSCNFAIPTSTFKNQDYYDTKNEGNFYVNYYCSDRFLDKNRKITKEDFSYVIIYIDIASMICLLICLFIMPVAQRKTNKNFKKDFNEISEYTIHFTEVGLEQKDLPKGLNEFLSHLYDVAKQINNELKDDEIIYDFNYPVLTDEKLKLISDKNQKTENLNKQTQAFEEEKKEWENLQTKIGESNSKNLKIVNDIYVTFANRQIRNKIFKQYNRDLFSRCCLICCCQMHKIDYLYLKNKWLNIEKSTDQPSDIRWPNIPFSSCKRKTRKTFAIIIAIIVIFSTFGIEIGKNYQNREINKKFNTKVNCKTIEYNNTQLVIEEYNDNSIEEKDKTKCYCFCKNTLIKSGPKVAKETTLDGKNRLCESWLEIYIYSQSLVIGSLVVIFLVSQILNIILDYLTEFERNQNISVNIISIMWKTFLLNFINIGVAVLLVNYNCFAVGNSFPLMNGDYVELTPEWYKNVGVTIISVMIQNMFSPYSLTIVKYTLTSIKRYYYKGKETKLTRKQFFELNLGPEFNFGLRYAQMLTTICVILMYSSGMPILYVCCCCYFLLTYWIDKWLILRFYRAPPKIDLLITDTFNLIIFFGIIVHFVLGIWIYNSEDIITKMISSSALGSLGEWIENNISFGGIVDDYVLTYSGVLCLIFIFLIGFLFCFRLFLTDLIMKYMCCCILKSKKQKESKKNASIFEAIGIKGLYDNHQWRKAKYCAIKNDENCGDLKKKYLKMLYKERQEIIDRFNPCKDVVDISNFDEKMPGLMQKHKEQLVEPLKINSDYSYNICHHFELQDAAYYEYILPCPKENRKIADKNKQ